jgi:hypothetical protein
MPRPRKHLKSAYKSGLEDRFHRSVKQITGIDLPYEQNKVKYTIPSKVHTYTPDFPIAENVYIETKGLWTAADRKKALLIQEQHPEITILYVFQRDQRITKKSNTTYIDWATKNDILACTFVEEHVWTEFITKHIKR